MKMGFYLWLLKRYHDAHLRSWLIVVLTACTAFFSIFLVWNSFKQVAIYTEATHVENRAYLVETDFDFGKIQEDSVLNISFLIKNLGKTPAYKIGLSLYIGIRKKIPDSELVDVDRLRPDTGFTLGPGLDMPIDRSYPILTHEYYLNLAKDSLILYIVGNVAYQDVFKKRHHTHFLYTWGRIDNSAVSTPRHGDAD